MSTEELLNIENERWGRDVGRVLAGRTSERDTRLLIAAAREGSLPMRGPSIEALAHQQRVEALYIAAELCDEIQPRWLKPYMLRALVALRYDATRPLAHEWLGSDQTMQRRAAARILEEHAEAGDLAMIRSYLRADPLDCRAGDMYFVCDLVAALARHPREGPYDELDEIFDAIPYSFGRRHVAGALAVTDPEFAETRAIECLWDCEPAVRTIGVEYADRYDPAVRDRLQVMAADWAEDPDTQQAAKARLNQH